MTEYVYSLGFTSALRSGALRQFLYWLRAIKRLSSTVR